MWVIQNGCNTLCSDIKEILQMIPLPAQEYHGQKWLDVSRVFSSLRGLNEARSVKHPNVLSNLHHVSFHGKSGVGMKLGRNTHGEPGMRQVGHELSRRRVDARLNMRIHRPKVKEIQKE